MTTPWELETKPLCHICEGWMLDALSEDAQGWAPGHPPTMEVEVVVGCCGDHYRSDCYHPGDYLRTLMSEPGKKSEIVQGQVVEAPHPDLLRWASATAARVRPLNELGVPFLIPQALFAMGAGPRRPTFVESLPLPHASSLVKAMKAPVAVVADIAHTTAAAIAEGLICSGCLTRKNGEIIRSIYVPAALYHHVVTGAQRTPNQRTENLKTALPLFISTEKTMFGSREPLLQTVLMAVIPQAISSFRKRANGGSFMSIGPRAWIQERGLLPRVAKHAIVDRPRGITSDISYQDRLSRALAVGDLYQSTRSIGESPMIEPISNKFNQFKARLHAGCVMHRAKRPGYLSTIRTSDGSLEMAIELTGCDVIAMRVGPSVIRATTHQSDMASLLRSFHERVILKQTRLFTLSEKECHKTRENARRIGLSAMPSKRIAKVLMSITDLRDIPPSGVSVERWNTAVLSVLWSVPIGHCCHDVAQAVLRSMKVMTKAEVVKTGKAGRLIWNMGDLSMVVCIIYAVIIHHLMWTPRDSQDNFSDPWVVENGDGKEFINPTHLDKLSRPEFAKTLIDRSRKLGDALNVSADMSGYDASQRFDAMSLIEHQLLEIVHNELSKPCHWLIVGIPQIHVSAGWVLQTTPWLKGSLYDKNKWAAAAKSVIGINSIRFHVQTLRTSGSALTKSFNEINLAIAWPCVILKEPWRVFNSSPEFRNNEPKEGFPYHAMDLRDPNGRRPQDQGRDMNLSCKYSMVFSGDDQDLHIAAHQHMPPVTFHDDEGVPVADRRTCRRDWARKIPHQELWDLLYTYAIPLLQSYGWTVEAYPYSCQEVRYIDHDGKSQPPRSTGEFCGLFYQAGPNGLQLGACPDPFRALRQGAWSCAREVVADGCESDDSKRIAYMTLYSRALVWPNIGNAAGMRSYYRACARHYEGPHVTTVALGKDEARKLGLQVGEVSMEEVERKFDADYAWMKPEVIDNILNEIAGSVTPAELSHLMTTVRLAPDDIVSHLMPAAWYRSIVASGGCEELVERTRTLDTVEADDAPT